MPSRRTFLRTVGETAVGTVAFTALGGACRRTASSQRRLERIGLQLYTVRGEMDRDFERTLARVAEIGYAEVEFAGYFDRSPAVVRQLLDANGLTAPSAHIPITPPGDDWSRMLEAANTMGHRYLVVASIPRSQRSTLDGYRAVAETFNQVGEAARAAGIRFAFHNHAGEFAEVEGQVPFDLLLAECEPDAVQFQMDLFWITRGGGNPVEYFRRYPGRFTSVHVKDMAGIPDGDMVDVGRGTIDFAAIFANRELAGIEHYFVEHDEPASPFDSIRASYEYLERLTF